MRILSETDIFPRDKIEVVRTNPRLLDALAIFCDCTQQELIRALYSRIKEHSKDLVYSETIKDVREQPTKRWYYKRARYVKWKLRDITTPNVEIKKVQDGIYKRLDVIPVSLKSTAGKKWDSPENHAEPHRFNRYLVTIDIQSAYPNVDAQRVYETFTKTLTKPLGFRFSTLLANEKDLFLRCIVFLTIYQNELPQWVTTSDKLINIVLWNSDRRIQKFLSTQTVYLTPRYTRYKDDMAISYRANSTIYPLLELLRNYKWKFETLFTDWKQLYPLENMLENATSKIEKKPFEQLTLFSELEERKYESLLNKFLEQVRDGKIDISAVRENANYIDLKTLYSRQLLCDANKIIFDFDNKKLSYVVQVRELIHELLSVNLTLTNTQESNLFHLFVDEIRSNLMSLRENHVFKREWFDDYTDEIYKNIYGLIRELDLQKNKYYIQSSWYTISALTEKMVSILGQEWRKVNPTKTKTRTPSSSDPREITWLAFNERWERVLTTAKRKEYLRMYEILRRAPLKEKDRLERKKIYRQFIINDRVDPERVKNTISGIRWRIQNVYGHRNPPRELLRYYAALKEIRLDQWGERWIISLEEDYGILPIDHEKSAVEFERKLNEIRFNETPMRVEDYERVPFPEIADEVTDYEVEDSEDWPENIT